MNIRKQLNEASPADVMKEIAGKATKDYPKFKSTGPAEGPTEADVKTLLEPKDLIKDRNLPCIVYLADNQQHYEEELGEELTPDFLNGFGAYILKVFNTKLLFSDRKNFTATLFANVGGVATVCRKAEVVDGSVTVEEPLNLFGIKATITDVNEKETEGYNQENILESSSQINKVCKAIVKSLNDIEIPRPTVKSLGREKVTLLDIKIGAEFYELIIENESDETKVPKVIVNPYKVDEIQSANKTVITDTGEAHNSGYVVTSYSGKGQKILKISDVLEKNYFKGTFEPQINYNTCLIIRTDFKQLSGKNDVLVVDPITVYTSLENWKEWVEKHSQKSVHAESFHNKKEKPINNYDKFLVYSTTEVTIQAYDVDRKLFKKVIVPLANISTIKQYIYKFVNDIRVFFVDAYDNIGVCYFQAERMLDEENCYVWNVLKDDFYKKPIEYHYTQINEDAEDSVASKWTVAVHFDLQNGDESIPDKFLQVTAESEELARKYAEQYIRKMSLSDDSWKEAIVDSISLSGGDI